MTREPIFPPLRGLGKSVREAFGLMTIGERPFISQKTMAAFLERGLIVRMPDKVLGRDAFGAIAVPDYEIPISVHMEWCQWCADNFPDEDDTP